MNDETVGVIGTGIMGEPIARNLLRAGYTVLVHNRTRAKTDALCSEGACWKKSPSMLAHDVEVLLSIVSDSPDVESVYLG